MSDLKTAGVAPLYSLAAEYAEVLARLDDPDADAQELEQQLDAIAGAITQKADGISGLVKHCESMATMRKTEADRMRELAASDQRKADKLRDYLLRHMVALGIEKIDTARFRLSLRQNPPAVSIVEELLVPAEYMRVVTSTSIDKRAVLDNFKATGEIPPGIDITRSTRLEVK